MTTLFITMPYELAGDFQLDSSTITDSVVFAAPMVEPEGTLNRRAVFAHEFTSSVVFDVLSEPDVTVSSSMPGDWTYGDILAPAAAAVDTTLSASTTTATLDTTTTTTTTDSSTLLGRFTSWVSGLFNRKSATGA